MFVTDNYVPGSGMVDARDHIQQGGFSTARFPHDGDKLSVVQLQVDGFQGDELPRCIFVNLFHIPQYDSGDVGGLIFGPGNDFDGGVCFRCCMFRFARRILIWNTDDAIHNLQTAGEAGRKTLIMRYHDDRFSLRHQFLENLQDGLGGDAVQVAGRLICNNQVRVVDQRAGNSNALFLSAGNMRRNFVGMISDFNYLQQFKRSCFADERLVAT